MARKIIFDIETTPRPGIMDTFYPMWAETKYPGKEGQELEDMAWCVPSPTPTLSQTTRRL